MKPRIIALAIVALLIPSQASAGTAFTAPFEGGSGDYWCNSGTALYNPNLGMCFGWADASNNGSFDLDLMAMSPASGTLPGLVQAHGGLGWEFTVPLATVPAYLSVEADFDIIEARARTTQPWTSDGDSENDVELYIELIQNDRGIGGSFFPLVDAEGFWTQQEHGAERITFSSEPWLKQLTTSPLTIRVGVGGDATIGGYLPSVGHILPQRGSSRVSAIGSLVGVRVLTH